MRLYEQMTECAFEPDSVEILCIDCGKPTGITGTCEDVGFCQPCRDTYIAAGITETEFSEMLISLIEDQGYKAKFHPHRVLHISLDGKPACGIQGGPHPLTTNTNESNCKRCLQRIH